MGSGGRFARMRSPRPAEGYPFNRDVFFAEQPSFGIPKALPISPQPRRDRNPSIPLCQSPPVRKSPEAFRLSSCSRSPAEPSTSLRPLFANPNQSRSPHPPSLASLARPNTRRNLDRNPLLPSPLFAKDPKPCSRQHQSLNPAELDSPNSSFVFSVVVLIFFFYLWDVLQGSESKKQTAQPVFQNKELNDLAHEILPGSAKKFGDVIFNKSGGFHSPFVTGKEVADVPLCGSGDMVGYDLVLSNVEMVETGAVARAVDVCVNSLDNMVSSILLEGLNLPSSVGATDDVVLPVLAESVGPSSLVEVPIVVMSPKGLNAQFVSNLGVTYLDQSSWFVESYSSASEGGNDCGDELHESI
ncbi:hypothetical protein M5K25_009678 [Dendrobium thyrsiflorum]|uniref:Uncharacterized protein n=1 Tax=Dendrobium thyrsiflorum TaxID=117978 RepID=A0ABD0V732_DENTH